MGRVWGGESIQPCCDAPGLLPLPGASAPFFQDLCPSQVPADAPAERACLVGVPTAQKEEHPPLGVAVGGGPLSGWEGGAWACQSRLPREMGSEGVSYGDNRASLPHPHRVLWSPTIVQKMKTLRTCARQLGQRSCWEPLSAQP